MRCSVLFLALFMCLLYERTLANVPAYRHMVSLERDNKIGSDKLQSIQDVNRSKRNFKDNMDMVNEILVERDNKIGSNKLQSIQDVNGSKRNFKDNMDMVNEILVERDNKIGSNKLQSIQDVNRSKRNFQDGIDRLNEISGKVAIRAIPYFIKALEPHEDSD